MLSRKGKARVASRLYSERLGAASAITLSSLAGQGLISSLAKG